MEVGRKRGKRTVKVDKGPSLERMALVALGPGMPLSPWPAKVAEAEWSDYALREEWWMYATPTSASRSRSAASRRSSTRVRACLRSVMVFSGKR